MLEAINCAVKDTPLVHENVW